MAKIHLSEEQTAADEAISRGQNVLVTGQAGTGKSTLLNVMRKRNGARLAVTASTGIAALNVGGTTLHTFAGLGLGTEPGEEIAARILESKGRSYRNIFHAEVIAIDEVSMISAELFDKVDEVFRLVRDNGNSFGGVQIVCFGDFLQLPPVSRGGAPAKFAFESSAWESAQIETHMLTKVYRQRDQPFANALGRLRVGDIHHPDVELLASRANVKVPNDGIRPVLIHTHNQEVMELNRLELAKLKAEEFTFPAIDRGRPDGVERLNRDCLAPQTLSLKKGAQVMLLANLDVEGGLVNGSIGLVETVKEGEIVVRFPKAGRVTVERREWAIQNNGSEIAARTQYPLRLSWALSAHKCQGMTLDRIECHLGRVFEPGQAYVAISRAKTLDGLFLRKTTRHAFRAHPKAVEFYRQAALARAAA